MFSSHNQGRSDCTCSNNISYMYIEMSKYRWNREFLFCTATSGNLNDGGKENNGKSEDLDCFFPFMGYQYNK